MREMSCFLCFLVPFITTYALAGDKNNCSPRWMQDSKSQIFVNFYPMKGTNPKELQDQNWDFQSISVRFPADWKEIMACTVTPKTMIQLRYYCTKT